MLDTERANRRALTLQEAAIAGLLLLLPVLVLVYRDHMIELGAWLAALVLIAASYHWPLPMLTIELFLSTSALKFIGIKQWPHLIGGLPLDPPDILVLIFFGLGVAKLIRRHEQPLFLGPLLLFGLMAALSAVLAPLTGTQSLYDSLNGLRQLSGYLFYFGVVGAIDTPGRLRSLIRVVFVLLLVTVGIQLAEALRGQQFTTAIAPFNAYYSGQVTVSAGDLTAPYLWNRAQGYLVVGLFLALGQWLWARGPKSLLLVALAITGYVLQMIRQWYLFIALGSIVSLLLLRRGRLQAFTGLILLLAILGLFLSMLTLSGSFAFPVAKLWLARISTLANMQQEPNFVFRLQTWQEQLRLFRQAPLFGQGPGSSDRLGQSDPFFTFFDLDTGMSNTLLQYGIFGTAAIWVLIASFLRQASSLLRALATSPDRGYVAGLLALWLVMIAGYLTSQDFFTAVELVFATGLTLALLDRLHAFARPPRADRREGL